MGEAEWGLVLLCSVDMSLGPELPSTIQPAQNCHQWSILESLDDKFQDESTASTILVHSKAPQKSIL